MCIRQVHPRPSACVHACAGQVAKRFPNSAAVLKFEGLRLAMRRSMILISMHAKQTRERHRARESWERAARERGVGAGTSDEGGTAAPSGGQQREAAAPEASGGVSSDQVLEEAMRAVLHPHAEETWTDLDEARRQLREEEGAPPRYNRKEEHLVTHLGQQPVKQQMQQIARMLLDVNKRLDAVGVPGDALNPPRLRSPTTSFKSAKAPSPLPLLPHSGSSQLFALLSGRPSDDAARLRA